MCFWSKWYVQILVNPKVCRIGIWTPKATKLTRLPLWRRRFTSVKRFDNKGLMLTRKGNKDREIIHAKNILRPQEAWRHRVDNSYGAFIPKITSKPHARQPLDEGRNELKVVNLSSFRKETAGFGCCQQHEVSVKSYGNAPLKRA